ncbi:MAG: hypothetical protein WC644_11870 [Ignavibacteria bacterium]
MIWYFTYFPLTNCGTNSDNNWYSLNERMPKAVFVFDLAAFISK